jgi:hypothetical protein
MGAPPAGRLDGRRLGGLAAAHAPGLAGALVAAVHSRADGRLDHVELAVVVKAPVAAVQGALLDPGRWRRLSGWSDLTVRAPAPSPRWEVDSGIPFVDFDAVWAVTPGPPLRLAAVDGDWVGGGMGWDLVPAGANGTAAVYSLHPRLDRSGYMPRRTIDAEPLLEGGLTLGLAYVNALTLLEGFPR